jgi:Na+/H+ antiporter NhaD/arsenite permease-like protein
VPELTLTRVIALVAFAGTYLGLALGRLPGLRVDRTGVTIIGAAVMVVGGVMPWSRAVAAVDANTLALLFGMMVVAAYLRLSGFFHIVTHWAVRRARSPVSLLAVLVTASGVLAALFVNDVICLVLAPVVVDVARRLRLPPVPYLIALATAANVGSVATLTGNPQNMLVGSFSGISYRRSCCGRRRWPPSGSASWCSWCGPCIGGSSAASCLRPRRIRTFSSTTP